MAYFSVGFKENTFLLRSFHKKVHVWSIQQRSCQQSLQGKGHNFLINSAWSRNMEPLVLQNISLPRHLGLNSVSVLRHSNLPILPLSWPHKLLRSVNFTLFNFPRNNHLYNKILVYSLSPSICKTDCRSMFSFGSWNRNLTCVNFLKLVSYILNFSHRFTKPNIQTLATEISNF